MDDEPVVLVTEEPAGRVVVTESESSVVVVSPEVARVVVAGELNEPDAPVRVVLSDSDTSPVRVVQTDVETQVRVVREVADVVELPTRVARVVVEGQKGSKGDKGDPGPYAEPFDYFMPVAQTTATVDHTLGHDPVAVQVFDEDGLLCDGYGVVFTSPGNQVRVSFDISLKAHIRLL